MFGDADDLAAGVAAAVVVVIALADVAFDDNYIAVCVAFNVVIVAVLVVVIVVVAVDDPGVPAVAHAGAYYLSNNL